MSEIKEIIMNVILNNWVEIIGYLASLLIVASFLTSSLIKLRWINLIGVIVFITYGFIINSKPVLLTNLIIAIVNIYYLLKIYSSKEYFQLLEINTGDTYLKNYLEFYKEDIKKYFPYFNFNLDDDFISIYILRNMVTAGVFIGRRIDDETLLIELDFATHEYRDFKIGKFIYDINKDYLKNLGIKNIVSKSSNLKYEKYLEKMGFQETYINQNKMFMKKIWFN